MTTHYCNDYGDRVGCLKIPDERFTMNFEDIGEGSIYWCAKCGPTAHAMDKAIMEALNTRGTPFLKEFEQLVTKAHAEIAKS